METSQIFCLQSFNLQKCILQLNYSWALMCGEFTVFSQDILQILHGSLIYPKDIFVCQDAESRAEYGEMNVQRIHLQIDQLEDELIGQKQKCKAINDELQQTFNDMVEQYWPLLLLPLLSYHATWNTSLLHMIHWNMEDFTFNYKVVLAIKDMAQKLTWKRVTLDRITQCATTKVIHGRYSSHLNI